MSDYEKSLKILGLKEPFTEQELKSAYKKLVKKHHPDMFTNPRDKEKATKNFKKIQSAYEYLQKYGFGKSNSYTKTKDSDKDTTTNENKTNDENDIHDETVKNYRKRRQERKKDFYYYDDFDAEKDHQTHPDDFEYKEHKEEYQQYYNQTHADELKNGVLGLLVVCVIVVMILVMANGESEPKSNNSYRQNNRYERTNNYYANTNYQENYVKEEEPAYQPEPVKQTETQQAYQKAYDLDSETEEQKMEKVKQRDRAELKKNLHRYEERIYSSLNSDIQENPLIANQDFTVEFVVTGFGKMQSCNGIEDSNPDTFYQQVCSIIDNHLYEGAECFAKDDLITMKMTVKDNEVIVKAVSYIREYPTYVDKIKL